MSGVNNASNSFTNTFNSQMVTDQNNVAADGAQAASGAGTGNSAQTAQQMNAATEQDNAQLAAADIQAGVDATIKSIIQTFGQVE